MSAPIWDLLLGSGAAGALISIQLKAAVLLAVVWGVNRLARRASAAARHCMWTVALLGVICYPLAHYWMPSFPLDLPGLERIMEEREPARAPVAPDAGVMGVAETGSSGVATGVAAGGSNVMAVPAPTGEESGGTGWIVVLLMVWGAGVAVRVAYLTVQLGRTRRIAGFSRAGGDRRARREVRRIARTLGVRRRIRVLQSELVTMPLTWGAFRPTVVLPANSTKWPLARLRVVLLHELAHIRRWDYLASLLAELACAVYWPDPLVWVARHRIHSEQEGACDDLVLTSGTTSLDYAQHLLDIARAFHGRRWELGMTVAMARETSLKGRIRNILDERVDRRPLSSRAGLPIVIVLAGVAMFISAARPRALEPAVPDTIDTIAEGQSVGGAPVVAASADETVAAPVFLWIEAEQGSLTAPMRLREDLDASGGRYVVVPDRRGNDAPAGGGGSLSFSFEVPTSGEYIVWGRVIGDGDDDNSFYVSLDGSAETRWNIVDERGRARIDHWRWLPVKWSNPSGLAPSAGHVLSAGHHVLRVRNREDGTRLDRILVTNSLSFAPEGRGSVSTARRAYLWIEAENTTLTGDMKAREGHDASGGAFISVHHDRPDAATAVFSFDVTQPGPYVLWGRTLARNDDSNSFFISVDGQAPSVWDVHPHDDHHGARWSWEPVTSRAGHGTRPLLVDFSAGEHSVAVSGREKNTRLDGIYITNDLTYRPRGALAVLPPARATRVWLEAEDAALSSPLRVESDRSAANGRFVSTDNHVPDHESPDSTGSAIFTFDVPDDGIYSVWGRTRASDDSHDSFWVRVNRGSWIRWNGLPTGRSWQWSTVEDSDRGDQLAQFRLNAGRNSIQVAYRESGTKLDRLLVTNDPAYRPSGVGND